jgi:hypothetical protein
MAKNRILRFEWPKIEYYVLNGQKYHIETLQLHPTSDFSPHRENSPQRRLSVS